MPRAEAAAFLRAMKKAPRLRALFLRFALCSPFAVRLERGDYSLGDEFGFDEFLDFGRLDGFY